MLNNGLHILTFPAPPFPIKKLTHLSICWEKLSEDRQTEAWDSALKL